MQNECYINVCEFKSSHKPIGLKKTKKKNQILKNDWKRLFIYA